MRFNGLDLNLLVVLDALLTERHITRAGQKLFLSQSATSSALSRLREYFADDLLVQVGRKMMLTALGESLVGPVRDALLRIQATIERRPDFDPALSSRKFVFVMSDYTATVLMPHVLRAASRLAPAIAVEMETPSDEPIEALENGDVDFLLMPRVSLTDQHPLHTVFQESFVCVAAADNPLLGETLSLDQYLSLGHVLVRFGTQRRPSVDEWLVQRLRLERRVEVVATAFSAVPHYLVGTNRIATMHRRLAMQWRAYLPLRILPLPVDIPPQDWGLQWHRYRDHDPGTRWFRDLIVTTAGALDRVDGEPERCVPPS